MASLSHLSYPSHIFLGKGRWLSMSLYFAWRKIRSSSYTQALVSVNFKYPMIAYLGALPLIFFSICFRWINFDELLSFTELHQIMVILIPDDNCCIGRFRLYTHLLFGRRLFNQLAIYLKSIDTIIVHLKFEFITH